MLDAIVTRFPLFPEGERGRRREGETDRGRKGEGGREGKGEKKGEREKHTHTCDWLCVCVLDIREEIRDLEKKSLLDEATLVAEPVHVLLNGSPA